MRSRLLPLFPVLALLAGCGGAAVAHSTPGTTAPARSSAAAATTTAATRTRAVAAKAPGHALVDRYPAALTPRWEVISRIGDRPALWIARRGAVTLVQIDQHQAHLALHAGAIDPGGSGWRYGDEIAGHELHAVILGFNGGFKFATGAGGFYSFGRTGQPLIAGRGSIVTYRDGITQVGAWRRDVPARGRPLASVRQNLALLVDGGRPVAAAATCGSGCWGATLGGGAAVARSGLGIRSDGHLVWAAGSALTPGQLADGLAGAGAVRAVELDINPEWVAAYLYVHHRHSGLLPVPVVPGQYGIPGHLLAPYGRDFFTILANR